MNKKEKKAIEGLFHLAHINTYLDLEKEDVVKISRPLIKQWKDETETLLNLIEKQQTELEKKDKRLNRQFKIIQKRDKQIEELKQMAQHDWEERCRLTMELEQMKELRK